MLGNNSLVQIGDADNLSLFEVAESIGRLLFDLQHSSIQEVSKRIVTSYVR